MSQEEDLLRSVSRMAEERHLKWNHDDDSRKSRGHKGFPDLVIAGPRGTVFAELKTNGRSLTPDQRHWGSVLGKSGQRWYVWRPRDLASGIITETLDSIAEWKQLAL